MINKNWYFLRRVYTVEAFTSMAKERDKEPMMFEEMNADRRETADQQFILKTLLKSIPEKFNHFTSHTSEIA